MPDKKSSLKDAIMDLAKEIESVFRKYTRNTRAKAWEKITSKDGEREIKKILVDPNRQLSIFGKLALQNEGVRVWLDDERPMPEGYDLHLKTAPEAIELIRQGKVSAISLDHDLGPTESGTGYEVAKFIEEGAFQGSIDPIDVRVHSANPVGSFNIKKSIESAKRFWSI
jgi:hypothetical protein